MTDDTFASRLIGDVYGGPAGHTPIRSPLYKIAEAAIKPGFAARVSNGSVYLTNSSDNHFSGTVAMMSGHSDIDTAYSSSTPDYVELYPKGSGEMVWMYYYKQTPSAATAIDDGTVMCLSSVDGYITRGVDSTDADIRVGPCRKYAAGHATNSTLVLVQLSS